MIYIIQWIIKLIVKTEKPLHIGVCFDTTDGRDMFRALFKRFANNVPDWLIPTCTVNNKNMLCFGDVTIRYITSKSALCGQTFDIMFVSEDITIDTSDLLVCVGGYDEYKILYF